MISFLEEQWRSYRFSDLYGIRKAGETDDFDMTVAGAVRHINNNNFN